MNKKDVRFIETVRAYYKEHGRHTLPWRRTRDPYCILVSEIMLQQTQVDRVVPKYEAFLTRFPTVNALASSSLGDVLRMWQGLGYNRRAKMLHACAQEGRGVWRCLSKDTSGACFIAWYRAVYRFSGDGVRIWYCYATD